MPGRHRGGGRGRRIVVPLRHLDNVLASVRLTAARERVSQWRSFGDREDYLAFFGKSFGPQIAKLRGE